MARRHQKEFGGASQKLAGRHQKLAGRHQKDFGGASHKSAGRHQKLAGTPILCQPRTPRWLYCGLPIFGLRSSWGYYLLSILDV